MTFPGPDWMRIAARSRFRPGGNGARNGGGANGANGANGARRNQGAFTSDDEDRLTWEKVMGAFRGLPRVLKLVWDVQPFYTGALGALNIAQGLVPAATAWVSAQLINAVVAAITHQGGDGTTALVIWFVFAQFAIQAVSSLLSTISNIYQQLLQEKVAVDVQLKVMEKANQ